MDIAAPAGIGDVQTDIPDGVDAPAKFGFQPHDDREIAVAALLVEVASRLAAYSRLNGGVHVPGRETVAGRALSVDIDGQRELTERVENREVGYAANRPHRGSDLGCDELQRRKVAAEHFYGVLALDAGGGLLDVVLYVYPDLMTLGQMFCVSGPVVLIPMAVRFEAAFLSKRIAKR